MADWKCAKVYSLNKAETGVELRLRLWWQWWRLERARPRLPVTFAARSKF